MSTAMVAACHADASAPGALWRTFDEEAVARAFRPFGQVRLDDGASECAHVARASDHLNGHFGRALIGHVFGCEDALWGAGPAGRRLAASFAAVLRSAGDGEAPAPFSRSFERFGLPEAVETIGVVEPLTAALGVAADAFTGSASDITEVATLSRSGAAVIMSEAPLPVGVVSVPVPAAVAQPTAESAVVPAVVAELREAKSVTEVAALVVAAEQAAEPSAPADAGRRRRAIDSAAIRKARSERIAQASGKRRAMRTVSVSRTVRVPRARSLAGRPPRLAIRRPERISAPEPVVVARPQARSFSPKMSSAGPAQPTAGR